MAIRVLKKNAKRAEHERELCESVDVACPFCGAVEPIAIDGGGGAVQTFVEDCPVCCKPRVVHFDSSLDEPVRVERADGQ